MAMINQPTETSACDLHDCERIRLETIRHSLAHGIMRNVRSMTARWGKALASSSSVKTRAEYAELLAQAEQAFRIEEAYGQGCLLDLESSLLRPLIRSPEPFLTREEIAAAQRYRITMRGGSMPEAPQVPLHPSERDKILRLGNQSHQ